MRGYILIIISQIMLGSVAVFARWANLSAEVIVLFRCFFAAASIGLFLMFYKTIKNYLKPNKTFFLLVLTGLFMATNWLFFFKAVLTTTITNTILLYNLAPIFVLLSAVVFLKEMPTIRQVLCIAVSFFGVLVILGNNPFVFSNNEFLGGFYALVAGILYAQVTIIGRYLKEVPALVITFFQTSVGAILFLPMSIGELQTVQFSGQVWLILIIMGIFHTSVPYLMYFEGLKTVKASVAGILQYIYTLSTIIFGIIFFSEAITTYTVIGGLLIIVSSYIALKFPGKGTLRDLSNYFQTLYLKKSSTNV